MAPVPKSQVDVPIGNANYVSKRKLVPGIVDVTACDYGCGGGSGVDINSVRS